MVSWMQGLMLSLWLMSAAHAALDVKFDKSQSQLGEPLLLQIKSTVDLSGLDLSPLKPNFEIASQTVNRSSTSGYDQFLLEATLYPLRSGMLTMPKLRLGSEHSRNFSIQIHPANVSMLAWFPPGMPMERGATVLHLEIRDGGNLSWATPIEIDIPHATVRALPESTREESQNGQKRVVHHFRWQVLPLKEGNLTVNFSLLDAHRYAQRLRFPMSQVSTKIRAAPAYLPLNLPIGKPTIRMDPRPHQIVAGKPASWNIYVHAPGLSAEGLSNLLQYTVPAGLRVYPPSITPMILDGEGYLRITLSFIADRNVRIFPALRLPYFDQQQQRIETVTLPATTLQVRDLIHERLITGASAVATAGLLAALIWLGWTYAQRILIKRRWLAQLGAAQTPLKLYAALTKDSPWRVRTLRCLPAAVNIHAHTYTELERARFDPTQDAKTYPETKTAAMEAVAKIPLRVFGRQQFLRHGPKSPDIKSLVCRTRDFSTRR